MGTKDWMTVDEAAKRLGLSSRVVRVLLKSRLLGCRKVGSTGSRYQITETHLQAYLDSCEVAAKPSRKVAVPASPKPKAKPGEFGRAGRDERLDGKPPRFY